MRRWIKIMSVVGVLLVGIVVAGVAILKSIDFNQYKALIAEQAKQATGRDLVIAGDLNLEISLNPSVAVEGVSFANAAWGSRPEMITVKRFAAEVSLLPLLSGQVDINQVILEGVDLLLETDSGDHANWTFGKSSEREEKAESGDEGGDLVIPVVRMVRIKDVTVRFRDGASGEEHAVVFDTVELNADSATSPLQLTVAGSLNNQAFQVAGQVGSIDALAGGKSFPVQLDIAALAAKILLNGTLGVPDGVPSADIKLSIKGSKLVDTVAAAASLAPALKDAQVPPLGAYSLDVRAKFAGNKLTLDGLDAKLGSMDVSGRLGVDMSGARPAVDGVLAVSAVNLDELLPKSDKAAEPAPGVGTGDGRVFPDDPLPLDGLKAADAKLKLDIKKLIFQGIEVDDISVTVALNNGHLQIKPFSLSVAGGKVSGDLSLNGSKTTPSLTVAVTGKQIDYGALLKQLGHTDLATGNVDLDIGVRGSGVSVRALMAGLNGKVRVATKDGRIESGLMGMGSADILTALPGFDSEDNKIIRCGVVHFDINKGIAGVRAIVFESGGLSVIGTGDVNLRDEKLNLRIDPRAKNTSLATVAMVPLDVTGTLAEPSVTVDAAALAGNAAAGVARTVGAFATFGLSLLAEKAVSEVAGSVDDTDYCTPPLAGKKVVLGELAAAKAEPAPSGTASGDSPPPAEQPKQEEGVLEGIGSGLKSLFGN